MPVLYCITLRPRKKSPEPTLPSTTSKATHSEDGGEHKYSEATRAMSARSNKASQDAEPTHDGLHSFHRFFLEWLGQEIHLECEVRSCGGNLTIQNKVHGLAPGADVGRGV